MELRVFYREQPVAQEGSRVGLVLDTDLKILGFTKANLGAGKGPLGMVGQGPFSHEPLGIGMGGH